MEATGTYEFVTTWRIHAPRTQVWQALRDPERYPQWWPGMEHVEVVERGACDGTGQRVRLTARGRLPYRLRFETVDREIREPDRIIVDAVGELDGNGQWDLKQNGGVTTATYTWTVATTRRWMNRIEPFARPFFVWNHHVLMRWGGEGLARRLGGRLIDQEHTPPVRALDFAPSGALVAVLFGLVLWRRRCRHDIGGNGPRRRSKQRAC